MAGISQYLGELNYTCQPTNALCCKQLILSFEAIQEQGSCAHYYVEVSIELMLNHGAGKPHTIQIDNTNILDNGYNNKY